MEFLLQNLNTSLIVLAIAFSIILHYLAKNNKHRKQKSPPEAGGAWPILGHFLTFSRPKKLPHVALGEMADKYGPAFTIRLGVHKVLVISDWKMAKELCTSHDAHISSRPNFRAAKHLGYNYAMLPFTPYGPYWREIRKLTSTELLSKKRLEQLKHIRVSEIETSVKELYKVWTEKRFSGRVLVDMKKWFSDLTFNVLLQMVAGKRIGDEKEGRHIGGCEKAMKEVAKEMDSLFEEWLQEHRLKKEGMGGEENFIDAMLSRIEGIDLSGHDAGIVIKSACISLIAGGADTTLVMLTWALSLMMNNPQVWSSPLEFKPDRFINCNKEIDVLGRDFMLIPFGAGRRMCPGTTVTLQMLHLILANLLHSFELSNVSSEGIDMTETIGLSNFKVTPLEIFIAPRLSSHLY
nr:cytochrome P450 CYP82D47-like [Ipomoea batatas]